MPRLKTCKNCGTRYEPGPNARPFENWCSFDCGAELARKAQERQRKRARAKVRGKQERAEKAARAARKQRKEALKTKSDWMKEAQQAFNRYIRERDRGKPCISCDWPDDGTNQRHASHYRSVGAAKQLRFNGWNVHASCAQCNSMKSGNAVEYRIRLVRKIGESRVNALECNQDIADFSIDYLKRVKQIFNKRARSYQKRRENGQLFGGD